MYAATWPDLWSTREQRAQRLLDAKRPAAAAPLFQDPRRRGYAELQAGHYAQAAALLAPLKDAESQYNRGNALAHAGQLKEALAAYDAALAGAPTHQDAKHNRDIVARALKQQSQHSPSSQDSKHGGQRQPGGQSPSRSEQSSSGQQPNPAGQPQPGQSKGSPQSAQSGAQAGSQPQSGQGGSSGSAQPQGPNQARAEPQSGGLAEPGKQPGTQDQPSSQAAGQHAGARPVEQQPQQSGNGTGGSKIDPRQTGSMSSSSPASATASREAAGTGKDATRLPVAHAPQSPTSTEDKPPPQRSEQSLSLDQWLRGIPEDSGELLRRKFLIEHMMRQQANEP